MLFRGSVLIAVCCVLLITAQLVAPSRAGAQSAAGGGPLTGMLPDTEPTAGVLSVGSIKFAPGLTVREIGWDSNVFDEPRAESPKEDFVAAIQPDISAFTRLRWVRVSAYAGSELTYYRTYESERSIGHHLRGRFDFLLSRLRPFVGVGQTETRTRPNGEIDVRADRKEEELSGGLAFDLSPTSLVYGSAFRTRYAFEDALEDGVNLGTALTHDGVEYQAGLRTDITPLLSVELFGSYHEDEFEFEPLRNTESKAGTAVFRIAPEAVVTGVVTVGYRDMTPVDPRVKSFRGVTGSATITYPVLEIGRLTFSGTRGTEYSFDAAEAYYLQNSAAVIYTHRIAGQVDVQARGSRSWFDYSAFETSPAHEDTLDAVAGSVGYNLRNRTRIALNYEHARRRSPEFSQRNYDRRRVYLSWLFAF